MVGLSQLTNYNNYIQLSWPALLCVWKHKNMHVYVRMRACMRGNMSTREKVSATEFGEYVYYVDDMTLWSGFMDVLYT